MPDEQDPADVEQVVQRVMAAGVLVRPSDLDLVVFFARHPRTLLSSESLCAFLGYELKSIAESLEALLAAGILRRRQTSAHAARYYELIVDAPTTGEWFDPLLALARTRHGRLALLQAIEQRSSKEPAQSSSDAARLGPRRIVGSRRRNTNETKTG